MREKKNQLNNAYKNGNSGSQGWCSSASEAAIPLNT
jgi:hypothetical protein